MFTMSTLRNTPVIVNQKSVGILQNVCLDMVQKKVCALHVSCGLHGRYLIMPEDVLTISQEFILAANLNRYKHCNKETNVPFVRDTTGMLVGFVTDYAISKSTLELAAVEMRTGLLPREYLTRIWIMNFTYQIQRNELVVPASLGCELIYSAGGNA